MISNINYIQSNNEKVAVFVGKIMYETVDSLEEYLLMLEGFHFVRISKSCIINYHKIVIEAKSNWLFANMPSMNTHVSIPISREFVKYLRDIIDNRKPF